MKVEITRGFVDNLNGVKHRGVVGDVVDLPRGAKWVEDGFAVKVPITTKRKTSKGKK